MIIKIVLVLYVEDQLMYIYIYIYYLQSGNTIYAPFECYISYIQSFDGRYCNTELTTIRHEQGHLMKSAKLAIEITSPNGSYSCLLLIISDIFSPDLNIITDQYRRAKSVYILFILFIYLIVNAW